MVILCILVIISTVQRCKPQHVEKTEIAFFLPTSVPFHLPQDFSTSELLTFRARESFFLILTEGHFLFYCFLKRAEGGEEVGGKTEKHRCEKETLITCSKYPEWGANQQPIYVFWLGVEPTSFWCTGQVSYQLSHTTQGKPSKSFVAGLLWAPKHVPRQCHIHVR